MNRRLINSVSRLAATYKFSRTCSRSSRRFGQSPIGDCRSAIAIGDGVALRCVALRCVALRCAAARCVALRCVALRCAALRCAALRCAALRCAALRCAALRCAVLCCVALRCDALRCIYNSICNFTLKSLRYIPCTAPVKVECPTVCSTQR